MKQKIYKTNIVAVVVFKKNIVIKTHLAGLIFLCYFKKHWKIVPLYFCPVLSSNKLVYERSSLKRLWRSICLFLAVNWGGEVFCLRAMLCVTVCQLKSKLREVWWWRYRGSCQIIHYGPIAKPVEYYRILWYYFLRQDKLFNTRIRFGKNTRSFSNKRKPNTNKCSARSSMEYNAIT